MRKTLSGPWSILLRYESSPFICWSLVQTFDCKNYIQFNVGGDAAELLQQANGWGSGGSGEILKMKPDEILDNQKRYKLKARETLNKSR